MQTLLHLLISHKGFHSAISMTGRVRNHRIVFEWFIVFRVCFRSKSTLSDFLIMLITLANTCLCKVCLFNQAGLLPLANLEALHLTTPGAYLG